MAEELCPPSSMTKSRKGRGEGERQEELDRGHKIREEDTRHERLARAAQKIRDMKR